MKEQIQCIQKIQRLAKNIQKKTVHIQNQSQRWAKSKKS